MSTDDEVEVVEEEELDLLCSMGSLGQGEVGSEERRHLKILTGFRTTLGSCIKLSISLCVMM